MVDNPKQKTRFRDFYEKMSKSASEIEEGQARAREYRLALGTFVDAFAKVESAMYYVLIWHTKTKHSIGQAIFSGTRAETAAAFLGRLAENSTMDATEWGQLAPVLAQLRVINSARNLILHYGAQGVEEGRALVADALRAITVDRIRAFPISPEILSHMAYDCRKMFLHLMTRHAGRAAPLGKHAELEEILNSSWRYIPPRPVQDHLRADKNHHSPRPDKHQLRQPPPKSSPE